LLQAADAWFSYDERTPVVRGVTLDVPADGFVGILGPNGSGKTTLLRLLAGTRQPQRGAITLDGTSLSRLSRAVLARRMAVVPQETQLAFDYTVLEVAMMGRYPHLGPFEIEGPDDLSIVEEALEATGTRGLKDRLFATLSGGEKQRVVIAAALAQIAPAAGARRRPPSRIRASARQPSAGDDAEGARTGVPNARSGRVGVGSGGGAPASIENVRSAMPGILLLDEPTASLDLGYQLEIAALVRRLHDERGVAVVISTHDLNLAASLCRTLVLMHDGSVVASGATADVLTRENVRRLYGVDADVLDHPSGHRIVVPVRRLPAGDRR
jgi:iron complex transport system ATP-binding protein